MESFRSISTFMWRTAANLRISDVTDKPPCALMFLLSPLMENHADARMHRSEFS